MPMRKCKTVMEEIDRITDGDATRIERMRFAMHLAMCEDCDRYYRQYIAVREALGQVHSEDLPKDFDEVMAGLLRTVNMKAGESD